MKKKCEGKREEKKGIFGKHQVLLLAGNTHLTGFQRRKFVSRIFPREIRKPIIQNDLRTKK